MNVLRNIYDNMIINNLQKINQNGFQYDNLLTNEYDKRYCQAVFSIPLLKNSFLTKKFYELLNLLDNEFDGVTYHIDNNKYVSKGTFHFTFIQQLSFSSFVELPNDIMEQHHILLSNILKSYLPFKIYFNKLIAVPNGLVLCGYADIDINMLRDTYRQECEDNNLDIHEPYYQNIIHSTLFRFKKQINSSKDFLDKYEHYLNNEIDYGYIIIDHFNIGHGTWKLNKNEIKINYFIKNDS